MSRHFRKPCARGAGFSFVELLVTIVIAGIAFAAMVPVFVQATEKNSADKLRLQAANVAQDKIEKIRQLPYSALAADSSDTSAGQIDPNLYDPNFADKQFGPSTTLQTGSGDRVIHTDYEVTLYPAAATGLASQYKVVTVTARWDAPPSPVKPVVLQTIIYRQYAGPALGAFSTSPIIDDDGRLGGNDLTSVILTARTDTSGGVMAASVQFEVAAFGGQTIASKLVTTADVNPAAGYWYEGGGVFHWTWDCSTAANGVYDFQATAYSVDEYAGNSMHLYPRINHTVLPAPPGAVIATPGDAKVSLAWGVSTASGLTGYEVFRSNSANPASWAPSIAVVSAPSTTYTDTSVVNGTSYYYAVRAVTGTGNSALVVSNQVTPGNSADSTPPTAPASLVAAAAPAAATITLTWGPATDVGGVLQYEIWRSSDGITWGASPLTVWTNLVTLSYPDASAGWESTWYYRVRAVDVALNAGAWSAVVRATTVAEPYHDLRISVKNGNGNDCNVWVLKADTGIYYDATGADVGTTPPVGTYIGVNGTAVFDHLPDGAYTVFASKSPSPSGAKSYGVTVQAPYGNLTKVVP